MKKRVISIIMTAAIAVSLLSGASIKASAATASYASQIMQFVCTSDGYYVSASASTAGSKLAASSTSSALNKWEIVYGGSDYFKIKNTTTGYVLAPSGNSATSGASVIASSTPSGSSQYWKIVSVKTDANSMALNYKIVNYANTNLALTLSNGSYVLGTYSGAATQNFRFNSFGAEGFAGYSKNTSAKETTSVTGGVLGSVVYVSNVTDLQKYATGSTPYTIVISGNIQASSLTKVTVGQNKTFIGSYSNHTLTNIHFRCISSSGNVIFKNITFSHSGSINANDDIQMYISNGNKFWLDHCTFTGHTSLTDADVDKHLYVGLKADFVSVTGCKFMNHKYGLILGYPQEDGLSTYSGYPRMTIANNYFTGVVTRAPGLMRYGYFHCYNNYIYDFNLGYTPYTGCNIYSEKNTFEKGNHAGAVVDDKGVGAFTDSGSTLSTSVTGLATKATSWRPSSNYGYSTRTAAASKTWVTTYAGSQSTSVVYPIN